MLDHAPSLWPHRRPRVRGKGVGNGFLASPIGAPARAAVDSPARLSASRNLRFVSTPPWPSPGLRWGELAGLKVGDRVAVPGPGFRLQRTALAGGGTGDLFIDTLKSHQTRTVPLTAPVAEIVAYWAGDRPASEWLFPSATGTPLREGNWKRSVRWTAAKQSINRPELHVHDLRHTAASIWLGAGADVKVVIRILRGPRDNHYGGDTWLRLLQGPHHGRLGVEPP